MKLFDLITYIQRLCTADPNVGFCKEGDIYALNKNQDISYPAAIITQGSHRFNYERDNTTYTLNVFFVDRLTEDSSNKLQVESWAADAIKTLIRNISDNNLGIIEDYAIIKTFTERFESLCAGAFVELNITVDEDRDCQC